MSTNGAKNDNPTVGNTIKQLQNQEAKTIYKQIERMLLSPATGNTPLSTYEVMIQLKGVVLSYESWTVVGKQLHKLREERKINGKLMKIGRHGGGPIWVWWKNYELYE